MKLTNQYSKNSLFNIPVAIFFLFAFLSAYSQPSISETIDQVTAIKIAESDAGCGKKKICLFEASSLDKGWYIIVKTVDGYRENGDPVLKPDWVGYIISSEGKLLDKKPGR